MDLVQANNNRDGMNNEVSSTSSEDTQAPVKRFTKLYKKHYKNDSALSDNEMEPRRNNMQTRNHYKSTGNLNEGYRDFRTIQNSISNIDLSLHGEEIKKYESLQIPIVGYEIMEERARFTIYKLKVEDDNSDQSWLVFRRYTDFVRLYSRIKAEQPNLNLPLPGKRWFRDNFEPAFLEDRVRGLQIFVNAILSKLPNHPVVREFFCLDEPPQVFSYQPEVQAVYGALEDSITTLKMQLKQKDATIMHLQKRLAQFEAQVKNCGSCSTNLSI
ncbi:sorting nexin-16 [Helicoverpa zea]|uniref:sorting nexin-16 n=1 Tax=Helicoverpa zea TaxID=7113 RepID=UPI001F5908CD|nr:sorting nexin-16 [Helicoverpa zea]XP_047040165.1 sorting nexin-16 [Helicoverpa zea]